MTLCGPVACASDSADGASARPVVRLVVSAGSEDYESFVPLLEGRLLERLGQLREADLSAQPAADPRKEWRLHLSVTDLRYDLRSEQDRSRDGDAARGAPRMDQVLMGDLELEATLLRPGETEPVTRDRFSVGARRIVADAADVARQRGGVVDDLLERATERIARILRKKVRP